jgi:hypothetical protein
MLHCLQYILMTSVGLIIVFELLYSVMQLGLHMFQDLRFWLHIPQKMLGAC